MDDLAMYLFDLTQNAIRAQAKHIRMTLHETSDELRLTLSDDGCGMDEQTLEQATSPYFTTRTTRKVGLGLSMIDMVAKQTEGTFKLDSKPGIGTNLYVTFHHHHIDMPAIGNLGEMIMMIAIHQDVSDFTFIYEKEEQSYQFILSDMKTMFQETLSIYSVMDAMTQYINQEINKVRG